ncbi:hypothetical protein M378DRAFT_170589 [Amanita muscaria Koide BX008]|uniref:HNH nuclease domain-containing protein n=1 Tax=Amanita muscaria (strain Koide BX008) TaxID=946122 RepID=A0A0C2SWD9_AMAMK|nr:hypothetical protein M378DRAFT_170589 [Amanita muscaria Koide BX008]
MVRQKVMPGYTSKQKYTPPLAASPATPPHQLQQRVAGTPPGRAHTITSLTTNAKQRLHVLDSGRCLITFEKTLSVSQQAVHIVARRTKPTDLTRIEKMWKISSSSLNLDSTKNLVTLRADWHLSYDADDWAFVPTENILRRILKYKASSFDMPYPEFNLQQFHDYVFVPLRILRRHYIFRQVREFNADDESEYEYEYDEQAEGEHIENGEVTVHQRPFVRFPVLRHHAHPFFVIYNALPKLRKHQHLLRQQDIILLTLMEDINRIWMSTYQLPSLSKPGKRRRPSDDDDDSDKRDDKDAHGDRQTRGAAKRGKSGAGQTKTRETRSTANVGKGKGKATAGGLGKTTPAQPQESRYLPPTPTSQPSRDKFLFDDTSEVAAWAAAVATAGPPEDTDETVIWLDEEPVRSPIQTWDQWHIPYKQPKRWARFCSYDWAMYFYSLPLWMPPMTSTEDPVAGECVTD